MEEDEKGYSPELWQKMAQQGWMGLIIPEQYGGTGMNICELVVLLEEFGRALVPGPFISTVVLGGAPIMEAGTEEQKQQFLPKIASGEMIMTMALTEPSAKWTADGVQLEAKKDGSDYVLNGTKLFVQDAHVSDYMVVVARTGGSGEDGITLFLVDSKSPGIKFEVLKTIAADKQCEVVFENVKVPAANMLGAEGKGWPIVEKTEGGGDGRGLRVPRGPLADGLRRDAELRQGARAVRAADRLVPGDPAQARGRRHRRRRLAASSPTRPPGACGGRARRGHDDRMAKAWTSDASRGAWSRTASRSTAASASRRSTRSSSTSAARSGWS